ncbi:DNA breaking-rejoining protein, partial [Xenorhabdus bovienii]|nr:DNA breaking-rejoining protein [Xenorhabdus bovienii]
MANCPVETNKLIGRNAIIRIAHGCPDAVPDQSAFFRIGALTTKSFDLSPNTLTSEADDSKGLVESVVTSMNLTISFDGEYRKRDKKDDFGPLRLLQEIPREVQAGRQPSYWVQMDFTGENAFVLQGYMVFTSWSSKFG